MSAFEKYVEQAAEASWNNDLPPNCSPWDRADEIYKEGTRISMRAALAAVGPLIEEETRDRMVTAAGRALDRESRPVHKPFPDDGVTYCGWSTGTQVIEGCGETWPCSTVRARGIATEATP